MTDFEETTRKYSNWLHDEGVNFLKKTEIKDLRHKNEGRGVIALEDIEEDEVIFEIPRAIVIDVENNTLVKEHPEVEDKLVLLNQWEALIVVLLYELKTKKDKSKWDSYFQALPIFDDENYVFNQLMFWSDEELKYLAPSLITQRIGREMADGMYKKLFPRIVLENMKLRQLGDTSSLEYHRVASLIMSYSFDVERLNERGFVNGEEDDVVDSVTEEEETSATEEENEEDPDSISDEFPDSLKNDSFLKAMIPLADTLNADTNLHNASLQYEKDKLVVRAIKRIKSGEQIYNSYSDHPNSEILRRYGYVERSGSKHDFGEIPLSLIRQYFGKLSTPINAEFFDELINVFHAIIEDESSDDEPVDFVLESYDCFVTGDIIIELVILLQTLTIVASINSLSSMESLSFESKFQLIRRIHRKCIQLIESTKLTKSFLAMFKGIINERLKQYPESARKPLKDDYVFSRESMAAVVLHSEYKSLENCLDLENTLKFGGKKYHFIEDDKLIRNIVKRKFDLPIIDANPKKHKK